MFAKDRAVDICDCSCGVVDGAAVKRCLCAVLFQETAFGYAVHADQRAIEVKVELGAGDRGCRGDRDVDRERLTRGYLS